MILALDTATRAFSVALFHERMLANVEFVHDIARSQSIVGTVDFMLENLRLSVKDLEAVYAGLGPGSFTGIRIGLSFANTLLQTMEIPLLGVSSLDLLVFGGGEWYNSAVSFIRSRKEEVYAALYRGGRRVSEYLALRKDDFLKFLRAEGPERLVCIEGDYWEMGLDTASPPGVKAVFSFPKAAGAFSLARARGLVPRMEYLKPLYVRDSHAISYIHG